MIRLELAYEMLRWETLPGRPGWQRMMVNNPIEQWLIENGVNAKLRSDLSISICPFLEFETDAEAMLFKLRWL